MIQNKINQMCKDELEEDKKQNKFLNNLRNQIIKLDNKLYINFLIIKAYILLK